MKHDYRNDPDSDDARDFLAWLETESVALLRRDYGNVEAVKSTVFLYVNRACEAGLPDSLVAEIFGRCLVTADYNEEEQEAVLGLFDSLIVIAKEVHSASTE